MSGGYFNYSQYAMGNMADDIENAIEANNFNSRTIEKFKEAIAVLRIAAIMVHRIDWLLSDDDGEETFHTRWDEELKGESNHD